MSDIEYLGTRQPTVEEIEQLHIPADWLVYEWKRGEARAWVPISPEFSEEQALDASWARIQRAFDKLESDQRP